MDLSEFARKFPQKMQKLRDFVEGDDIKDIMGTEAVNHFNESFQNEGFTDETLTPWEDVKRRDKDSPWHGHSSQTGKFSAARTAAKILSGETGLLAASNYFVKTVNGVKILNDAPYASVHQFGKQAFVYGKKEFTMTARPFFGKSVKMVGNIKSKIKKEITNIIKE